MPLIYFPPFFLIWFLNRNITLWPQQNIFIIGCIMETRCEKYKYLFWPQPPKDSQFKKIFSFPRVLENSGWSISYQQKSLCVMNKERRPKETLWSLCICGCSSPRPSQTSMGTPLEVLLHYPNIAARIQRLSHQHSHAPSWRPKGWL